MSKFRRQISGRAFNFLVSALPETSPVRQIFHLLRMVMHASPSESSDTLAKFSPLRQTVEGFVVNLVRDVSVPVFVQNLYLLLVNFDGPVLGCLENCNQLKAHVSSILCGTEMYGSCFKYSLWHWDVRYFPPRQTHKIQTKFVKLSLLLGGTTVCCD